MHVDCQYCRAHASERQLHYSHTWQAGALASIWPKVLSEDFPCANPRTIKTNLGKSARLVPFQLFAENKRFKTGEPNGSAIWLDNLPKQVGTAQAREASPNKIAHLPGAAYRSNRRFCTFPIPSWHACPRLAGRTRPPHSIAPQPLHGSTVGSTPLFSSLCKIFRTNDVNSPNTSTIIVLDKCCNPC